jgi:hypothetical protein
MEGFGEVVALANDPRPAPDAQGKSIMPNNDQAFWRRHFALPSLSQAAILTTLHDAADKIDAARGFLEGLSPDVKAEREQGLFIAKLAIDYGLKMLEHFGLTDGVARGQKGGHFRGERGPVQRLRDGARDATGRGRRGMGMRYESGSRGGSTFRTWQRFTAASCNDRPRTAAHRSSALPWEWQAKQ